MRRRSDPYSSSAAGQGRAAAMATYAAKASAGGSAAAVVIPDIPALSDATPADLGTADAGASSDVSRADHVHNAPDPTDPNAVHVSDPTVTFTNDAGTAIYSATGLGLSTDASLGINGALGVTVESAGTLTIQATGGSGQILLSGPDDTLGILIGADSNHTLLGFFGAPPVGRQTGGAATAGGTYTSAEQDMLNAVYTALQNLGLLS